MARAAVYVDGFNLWHGELRKTKYLWLDPWQLAVNVLPDKDNVIICKYFTARVSGEAADRQKVYLAALKAHRSEINQIFGNFSTHPTTAKKVIGQGFVRVWKREEKGTDVNIAIHMLNDAWNDLYDTAIVISNDSDLTTAIKMVRDRGKAVGVIPPLANGVDGRPRHLSAELREAATFIKRIRKKSLEDAQMPSPLPGTAIHRPRKWNQLRNGI